MLDKFDYCEFLAYMRTEFPEPMKNSFTYNLVQNVVQDLMTKHSDAMDFATAVIEIIPEITREEVLEFCTKDLDFRGDR